MLSNSSFSALVARVIILLLLFLIRRLLVAIDRVIIIHNIGIVQILAERAGRGTTHSVCEGEARLTRLTSLPENEAQPFESILFPSVSGSVDQGMKVP